MAEGGPRLGPLGGPVLDEPFRSLAELRRSCPVSQPGPGVHLVTTHAVAAEVLRDYRTYSTAPDLEPRETAGLTLLELEQPRHGTLRTLLLFTGLARDVVVRAETSVREVWRGCAEALGARGETDLVAEYSRPGTRKAFAELVGIPETDRERVYGWVEDMREDVRTSTPVLRGRASRASADAFAAYVREESDRRRRAADPPDDLFTRLLFVRDPDGAGLDDADVVMLMRLLCQAGLGSTSRLIGNLLFELARAPERYRAVRADRGLVPIAIDESLRHDPPAHTVLRTCTQDTELAGVRIARGEHVVVSLVSANRDENLYDNPEEFDLARGRVVDHLSFGRGRHRCVGAPLTRLVAAAALGALLDRIEELRLASGFEFAPESFGAWGPRRLDVELRWS
jgi:cytochrome P450